MTFALAFVRVALAAVFGVAAVAKLAGRERFRETLGAFGVSPPFLIPGALLIALTELTVAGLLVPSSTGRPAALAAATLTAVFSAVVARTLSSGKRPDCGCLGSLSAAPIGWPTLARNAALVALAVAVGTRPAGKLGWIEVGAAGGTALFVLQGWLWFELLRRYGRALGRIAELESDIDEPRLLEAGDEAHLFALPDLDGRLVAFESLLGESEETVLLFTSPTCGACELVLADAAGAGAVVVSSASPDGEFHGGTVLLDEDREILRLYGVTVVPTAFLVDRNGLVAVPPAVGAGEVAELVRAVSPVRVAGEAA
jgi:Methylamine utilisation protein MauE